MEGMVMKQDVLHDGDRNNVTHHKKPRHIAEKLEGYLGIGIVVVGLVLLAFLMVGFMQTGADTPPWMK